MRRIISRAVWFQRITGRSWKIHRMEFSRVSFLLFQRMAHSWNLWSGSSGSGGTAKYLPNVPVPDPAHDNFLSFSGQTVRTRQWCFEIADSTATGGLDDGERAPPSGSARATRPLALERLRRGAARGVASAGIGGVAGPWLPPTRLSAGLFWRDTAGTCQVDARPFAGQGMGRPSVVSSRNFWTVGSRIYGLPCPVRTGLHSNFTIWGGGLGPAMILA